MSEEEKCSRRQHSILQAVSDALAEGEYHQLTIEDVAARAGGQIYDLPLVET